MKQLLHIFSTISGIHKKLFQSQKRPTVMEVLEISLISSFRSIGCLRLQRGLQGPKLRLLQFCQKTWFHETSFVVVSGFFFLMCSKLSGELGGGASVFVISSRGMLANSMFIKVFQDAFYWFLLVFLQALDREFILKSPKVSGT